MALRPKFDERNLVQPALAGLLTMHFIDLYFEKELRKYAPLRKIKTDAAFPFD
jgi:hypothetical protein